MSTAPPRFVPTLTDIVQPFSVPALAEVSHNPTDFASLEEQILHRVMQRVDLVLERRLDAAVAQLVLAHTQALGPRLREEIEFVVRSSVSEAIAQELPPQTS